MGRENEREYDDFLNLKEIICAKVTLENAAEMLEGAKIQILNMLKKLNINNITKVEDLYLIVAQLNQAASYVAAQDKASLKKIPFEDALGGIGTDDLLSILERTFEKQKGVENFFKFLAIDKEYNPAKEGWAGLNARMGVIAKKIEENHIREALKGTVPLYLAHLKEKLKEHGVDIKNINTETPPIILKLITRYNAINDLDKKIRDIPNLDKEDLEFAKNAIKTCLSNKPDWSERPFLDKLTDVLSFGLKPLYRVFFSKEKNFQESIDHAVNPPKMGG